MRVRSLAVAVVAFAGAQQNLRGGLPAGGESDHDLIQYLLRRVSVLEQAVLEQEPWEVRRHP